MITDEDIKPLFLLLLFCTDKNITHNNNYLLFKHHIDYYV